MKSLGEISFLRANSRVSGFFLYREESINGEENGLAGASLRRDPQQYGMPFGHLSAAVFKEHAACLQAILHGLTKESSDLARLRQFLNDEPVASRCLNSLRRSARKLVGSAGRGSFPCTEFTIRSALVAGDPTSVEGNLLSGLHGAAMTAVGCPMPRARKPVRDLELLPLDDKVWSVIAPILAMPKAHGGRPPANYRRSLEGIRWIAWYAQPWRRLPERFGKADSVRRFHSRLVHSGRWNKLLKAFPYDTTKSDDVSQAKKRACAQLSFLRYLDDRLPRGAPSARP